MPETIKLEMTEKEAFEITRLMDECLEKIDKIFEKMDKDQVEIEMYHAQTRAVLDRLQAKGA
ncbi:MAG: hypothetical protein ACKVZH_06265 [Blastocatellia bacterium]